MKLNKKGWSFFQMFWMMGIILFFFLLTIILIWRFYRAMDYQLKDNQNIIEKRNKEQMIEDLNSAAYRYMQYNYSDRLDVNSIKIDDQTLFKAGLFGKDLYGHCTGYAIASKTNGVVFTRSYIKCNDYKSPGYEKN